MTLKWQRVLSDLAVELEDLLDVGLFREAAVLAHVVSERVVPVGLVSLFEERRVVEAHIFAAGHVLQTHKNYIAD
jgi:hypothetical protein